MASAIARARVPAGASASLAPLRAPPLNETVQLSLSTDALGRDNGTDVESVKRRIANLLSSEPGVGVCDSTPRERVANVVTSLPFFACGADLLRRARAAESRPCDASPSLGTREGIDARAVRRYGLCMFGVGAAACAYHLAPLRRRPLRVALRQADFTSIALASVVASEAYGAALPRWFRVGSLVAASRFPLLVSAAHCAASELAFLRRARRGAESAEGGCLPGVPRKTSRRGCRRAHARASPPVALAGFFAGEEAAPDAVPTRRVAPFRRRGDPHGKCRRARRLGGERAMRWRRRGTRTRRELYSRVESGQTFICTRIRVARRVDSAFAFY